MTQLDLAFDDAVPVWRIHWREDRTCGPYQRRAGRHYSQWCIWATETCYPARLLGIRPGYELCAFVDRPPLDRHDRAALAGKRCVLRRYYVPRDAVRVVERPRMRPTSHPSHRYFPGQAFVHITALA